MKVSLCILSLFFVPFIGLGQEVLLLNSINIPVRAWEYADFKRHNIQRMEAISYIDNGNLNDTVLIFKQEVDTANKVLTMTVPISKGLHFNWYYDHAVRYKSYYNKQGQLVKNETFPLDTNLNQNKKSTSYKTWHQTDSTVYHPNGQVALKLTYKFNDEFYRKNKKSELVKTTSSKLSKWIYQYNEQHLETKIYSFADSTRYTNTGTEPNTKKPFCDECKKEYLYSENVYDKQGNMTLNEYSSDGKLNRKHIIYYSKEKLPIKMVDTLYTYCKDCNIMTTIEDFYYADTLLTQYVRKEKVGNKEIKNITKYNANGDIVEFCYYDGSFEFPKYCEQYEYKYVNGKKTYEMMTNYQGKVFENYYTYNEQGWLIEQKKLSSGSLREWIKLRYK